MSSHVLGVVLLGALLHASWNAMVKSRTDTFLVTVLVAGGAGLLSALGLLVVAPPDAASWPYIAHPPQSAAITRCWWRPTATAT
jgi:hypothetical protein